MLKLFKQGEIFSDSIQTWKWQNDQRFWAFFACFPSVLFASVIMM